MSYYDSDEGPIPVEVLQARAAKAQEADLSAALQRAEQAEKAAAIWEQRASQATALSGQHLGELAAALRERDALLAIAAHSTCTCLVSRAAREALEKASG